MENNWPISDLSLLDAIPMTGYGIKKYFLSYFGINISFGTLYPRLKYFEKLEIIKPTIVCRSRGTSGIFYELTVKGKTKSSWDGNISKRLSN